MSSLSKHGARPVAVKKEVCNTIDTPENEEIPKARLVSNSVAAEEEEEDDIYHLSGKAPFFDVILAKSHVNPACSTVCVPSHMVPELPRAIVPVVLRHGGKNWTVLYHGDCVRPRFDTKWKAFVTDNHLKCGDACVFELIKRSSTNPIFKVHILRGDLPPELLEVMDTRGKTANAPIVID